MNVTKLISAIFSGATGITIATLTFAVQANNDSGHNWMPKQPSNHYWQAPDWSHLSMPPETRRQAPPAYTPPAQAEFNQRPEPVNKHAQPHRQYNYPAPNYPPQMNRRPHYNPNNAMPPGNMQRYAPPRNSNNYYPQRNQAQRFNPQAQPRGPYNGPNYAPNQGPSAFYTPGYRQYRGNNWNNNKFWGRSGPSQWMNPNKNNMEQGWDDMINAPSRMGEMPGGWTAPEVTMPNPIDMGDQMQDNLQDLPEQMRDMNVGNDVRN